VTTPSFLPSLSLSKYFVWDHCLLHDSSPRFLFFNTIIFHLEEEEEEDNKKKKRKKGKGTTAIG
jgi:hypothetical protein